VGVFPDRSELQLWHWGGLHWVKVAVPVESSTTTFTPGIWGSGPNDMWVTLGGSFDTLRWDGSTWTQVAAPCDVDPGQSRIWGAGPDDVWFVGLSSAACHWTGAEATVPMPATASAIWGADASNIWAVGTYGIFEWDGLSWSAVPLDAHRYIFPSIMVWSEVDRSSASDVWVATEDGLVLRKTQ